MKRFRTATVLLALLAVSGCGPGRAAADARLSKACVAALHAMYDPEDTIDIKSTSYVSERSMEDTPLRTVKFHAYYVHNHGIIEEKDYSCSFEELSSWPFGYHPKFYRMDKAGVKYGSFDGILNGELNDMMKINQATAPILD